MTRSGMRSPILAVNEDPQTLDLIAGILGQDEAIDVRLARSVYEGWRSVGQDLPDLVIFDFRTSAEWLRFRLRVKADDPVLSLPSLLVCERSEVPLIGPVLEQGADDYIEKWLCPALLLPRVRSMVGARRLQDELRAEGERLSETNALIEKNFKEMTAILLNTLEVRAPGASDRAENAKAMAQFVAARLDYPDEKQRSLVFAALLHEIGKVGLPDALVGKHYNSLLAALKPAYRQYSSIGAMIVSTISGYRESAEAIYHQLENEDGSGFPDELVGDEIPLNARILRAIVYQEELKLEGRSTENIVEQMRASMHSILDERIANLLIEFLLERRRGVDMNKLKLRVDELKAGMVIAEDVYAASGVKLLHRGVQLQDKILAVLAERNESDPIIGGVYILTDWGLLYGT